jgi:hypothetical protein
MPFCISKDSSSVTLHTGLVVARFIVMGFAVVVVCINVTAFFICRSSRKHGLGISQQVVILLVMADHRWYTGGPLVAFCASSWVSE